MSKLLEKGIMVLMYIFFAANVFHIRTFKELRELWGPRSTTSLLRRFYRFGNINILISLGTTTAYHCRDTTPRHGNNVSKFLLIDRFLKAYNKARTGDAVTLLGKLRPTEAILVDSASGLNLTRFAAQDSC